MERYRMKSGYKKLVCVLLIVLLVLPSAGCSAAKKLFRHESAAAKDSTDVGYQIYYIDSSGLELYPYAYKLEATKEDGIIQECISMLSSVPEGEDCEPVLGTDVQLQKYEFDSETRTLAMYCGSDYNNLSSERQILIRTAIVKTMTQFNGIIDYVSFNIDGNWLTNDAGETMLMKNNDYIITVPDDQEGLKEADIVLYFASLDGTGLVPVTVHRKYDPSLALESIVLDALIVGPVTDDCKEVLSQNTQVKDVYVDDGVCHVDFNSAFLTLVGNQNFCINVYSVVNSLTNLPDVDSVEITVNGEKVTNAPDGVDISGDLTADTGLIAGGHQ